MKLTHDIYQAQASTLLSSYYVNKNHTRSKNNNNNNKC